MLLTHLPPEFKELDQNRLIRASCCPWEMDVEYVYFPVFSRESQTSEESRDFF